MNKVQEVIDAELSRPVSRGELDEFILACRNTIKKLEERIEALESRSHRH